MARPQTNKVGSTLLLPATKVLETFVPPLQRTGLCNPGPLGGAMRQNQAPAPLVLWEKASVNAYQQAPGPDLYIRQGIASGSNEKEAGRVVLGH